MKNKKTIIITATAIIIIAGGCWIFGGTKAKNRIDFVTEQVQKGNVSNSITATGTIEPVTEVEVGTQVSGQELEQDKQEFEGLLLEVNCQIAELRNLLKEINAVKEELEKINQCSVSHIKAKEVRRQRLEQRNDALANEFRRLKPEIADAHKKLNNLIEGIAAYAGTMQNLHDLLKASFPIRFAENDRQALLEGVNAIADNAISRIRREREKADNDIRRNENHISMTQATFWGMIALLLILASFFALVIFANVKLLHLEILNEITVVYAGLIAITLAAVSFIFYKWKH